MAESLLKLKSRIFALRIIKLYKQLYDEQREFVMSKQLLRSGTSIGANVAEAFYAQSIADFVSKLYISRKEAGETLYWLELLEESDYISQHVANSIKTDCKELLKLLTASIITVKRKHDLI